MNIGVVILLLAGSHVYASTCVPELHVHFASTTPGLYSIAKAGQDWSTAQLTGLVGTDRASVVEENGNKFLRVAHPQGCYGPETCGMQLQAQVSQVPAGTAEVWVSYKFRVNGDFPFVLGGVMPGACGGTCYDVCGSPAATGYDGFSDRVYFNEKGDMLLEYNGYDADSCGTRDAFQSPPGGGPTLTRDSWNYLVQHVRLNSATAGPTQMQCTGEPCGADNADTCTDVNVCCRSAGGICGNTTDHCNAQSVYSPSCVAGASLAESNDGEVQVYLNGAAVASIGNLQQRRVATVDARVLFFSTFFGGDTADWAPPADTFVDFDDITFSTCQPPLAMVGDTPTDPIIDEGGGPGGDGPGDGNAGNQEPPPSVCPATKDETLDTLFKLAECQAKVDRFQCINQYCASDLSQYATCDETLNTLFTASDEICTRFVDPYYAYECEYTLKDTISAYCDIERCPTSTQDVDDMLALSDCGFIPSFEEVGGTDFEATEDAQCLFDRGACGEKTPNTLLRFASCRQSVATIIESYAAAQNLPPGTVQCASFFQGDLNGRCSAGLGQVLTKVYCPAAADSIQGSSVAVIVGAAVGGVVLVTASVVVMKKRSHPSRSSFKNHGENGVSYAPGSGYSRSPRQSRIMQLKSKFNGGDSFDRELMLGPEASKEAMPDSPPASAKKVGSDGDIIWKRSQRQKDKQKALKLGKPTLSMMV